VKFSISFIVPLVYHWNQCSVGTGAVGHAATGGGVLGGIYENNVIILLCGNIVKYIAISEILNSSYYPTCIPLKSMFRPDRRRCTCRHQQRGTQRHLWTESNNFIVWKYCKIHCTEWNSQFLLLSHLYTTEINVPSGPAPLHMPLPVEGSSEASTKIIR
jgi:hypothetical protein